MVKNITNKENFTIIFQQSESRFQLFLFSTNSQWLLMNQKVIIV